MPDQSDIQIVMDCYATPWPLWRESRILYSDKPRITLTIDQKKGGCGRMIPLS